MSGKITEDEVRHVAKLSRLLLSDDQVHKFTEQLSHVLDYVSKLSELDVDGVEPMAHAADVTNVLRDDEPQPGLATDAAIANAPASEPPFFKVPKVIGDGSGA
jgi:aspartyl-tRNA(Asn)/glutamyl-tRNA(Gln) amidotransferase subunit C